MSGMRDVVTWLSRWLFTILLAAAFLLASFLLAWHAFTAPKFEYGVAGELLLVAVLSLEGIVAVGHLRQARMESVRPWSRRACIPRPEDDASKS
jgi:hypothetical protein